MQAQERPWVVVAGRNRPTVLEEDGLSRAMQRAARISRADRVVSVGSRNTAATPWPPPLRGFETQNRLFQPEDKGTAAEILLALMHIMRTEPGTTVVIIPTQTRIADEAAFEAEVDAAVSRALGPRREMSILAGDRAAPSVVVARLDQLLRLYQSSVPSMLAMFLHELVSNRRWQPWQLGRMYQMFLCREFEGDVLSTWASAAVRVRHFAMPSARRPQLHRGGSEVSMKGTDREELARALASAAPLHAEADEWPPVVDVVGAAGGLRTAAAGGGLPPGERRPSSGHR